MMIKTVQISSPTAPVYSWAGRAARPVRKHFFNPAYALFFLLMLFGTTAQAARICVPSSFDASCNSSQATIAAAITAATSGVDNIYVQAGTYVENIDYSNKNITILSASGAATTILQKSVNAPIVNFNNAALTSAAVLDGFTIQNGNTGCNARGIFVGSGADPTIQNSIIKGNTPGCSSAGAGVYINASNPTFNSVTIGVSGTPNSGGGKGGGIYIMGAGGGASISNSTISYNTTSNSGGGIYVDNGATGALTVSNTTISFNTANSSGGGIFATGSTGTITIDSNSVISDNTGTNSGGGIYATGTGGALSISNATLSNNHTANGGGIYLTSKSVTTTITNTTISNHAITGTGGGIYSNGSPLNISGSTISGNSNANAGQNGGGLFLTGAAATSTITSTDFTSNSSNASGGGAIYISADADLTITSGNFNSNVAGSTSGGAIFATGVGTTVDASKVYFKGNDANQYGGGLYVTASASATLTNCNVTGNTADAQSYSTGGGINNNGGSLTLMSTTIAGNYAKSSGGGLSGGGTVTNSIFWGNTTGTSNPQINGTPTVTYSDISGGFAGTGNINSDPLFTDLQQASLGVPTTAGDFHIPTTSPAKDVGTATGAPADDIEGDARPQGSGIDMGADEYVITGNTGTTVGSATAVNAGITSIDVSMPYTDDTNSNNTYTVDYKLTSEPTVWTNWVTAAAHVATPYATTITGLTTGESYDVRVTYNDADGVSGTNPQTITGIVTAPIVRAVPGTYGTIQAAIDAASNGDTVQVANGTYSENINFNGKLVTVISQNGAALTTIQGTGANSPVVTFNNGETSSAVLDGFTINNQAAANTATNGIKITASSAPILQNLIIEGNDVQAGYYGGGVYINGGTATLQNSTLGTVTKPNSAGNGGGALYATALSAPLSVSNTTIAYNSALNGGAVNLTANGAQTSTFSTVTFSNNSSTNHGGAIYNDSSKLTVDSTSAFTSNVTGANMNGGAINIVGATSSVNISNTTFTSNSSGSYGGVISINGSTDASPLTISGSTFTNNGTGSANTVYGGSIALVTLTNPAVISTTTITGGAATNRGGNIYASAAPLTLTSVNVTNGTSSLEGGGMYLTGATTVVNMTGGSLNGNTGTRGGGAYIGGATLNTYSGTTISSNIANSTTGGGLDINSVSTVSLTKTTISGNRANQRGGGIAMALTGGTATLTNSNVTGNSADMQAYSNGGGIYDAGGIIILMNTTVAGNYATSSAAGFASAGVDDVVTNSIFWGNTAGATPEITGTPTVTYSDVSGGFAGTGNINSDPLFVTLAQASSGAPTTAGNFHIQSTSPAKNIGTATGAPADDIDGDARPQAGGYDMGSDEYPGNSTTLATGTDPGNASLAPGGAATMADAFTLQTSAGTEVITNVTVTLAAGTSAGLSQIEITDTTGGILYGLVSNPASDTPVITLSITTLTATTTATTYKIRVTPKSHANMPAPAGASYAVTAYISSWTGINNHLGSDTGGTTVTIDNLSPGNVTAATATAGDSQVSLAWTNPVDADLGTIVVLRDTAAVSDTPVEGATYTVGNTIGTSTVACVETGAPPATSCISSGLTNGTAYHYKIFAKDTNGNYSATGVVPTGSPATPVASSTTLTLHPSGLAPSPPAPASSGYSQNGGVWADILDSNDGDATNASICCSGPTLKFFVDMDDPVGLAGATINSVTIYAYIRNSTVANSARVGYLTDGVTNPWGSSVALGTSYALFSAGPYTTNSAGGPLTLADINNLQVSVDRVGTGGSTMYVTEVYAVVDYTPGAATTTLATGTDPGNTSLAPGGAATNAGAFSFQTSSGTDVITAATVTLAAGTSGGLSLVEITSADGATVYGSAANPASDTPAITLSTNTLTATTTLTEYRIRITPKSHANMPAPAGSSYAVTARISAFTGTNAQAGTDTAGTTVTIDNLSPANVTAATATAGNTQVVLGWTNPVDADFHSVVVLRRATSAVADVPVEGSTYVVGNTIGTATVACVVASPTATCTDTGLTNGTAYHYKIFAKDSNGNYSATGVVPTGSPATPAAPSLTFLKTVAVTSDPVNGGVGPKYIPGAEVLFTMRVTNSGAGTVDNNTLIITDPVPANVELFTGNLSGGAPFIFVDGTPVSGLSCGFTALNNFADCIDFSNNGGSTWTFVPNGSFDPAVTNIRFSLSGTMNGTGGGSPYFDLSFRVRVK